MKNFFLIKNSIQVNRSPIFYVTLLQIDPTPIEAKNKYAHILIFF